MDWSQWRKSIVVACFFRRRRRSVSVSFLRLRRRRRRKRRRRWRRSVYVSFLGRRRKFMFVSMFIFEMSRYIVLSRKLSMTFRTIRRVARIKMICLSKYSLIYLQYILPRSSCWISLTNPTISQTLPAGHFVFFSLIFSHPGINCLHPSLLFVVLVRKMYHAPDHLHSQQLYIQGSPCLSLRLSPLQFYSVHFSW